MQEISAFTFRVWLRVLPSGSLLVFDFVYVCMPGSKCARKRWRTRSAFLGLHQYGMLLLQWKLSIYAEETVPRAQMDLKS